MFADDFLRSGAAMKTKVNIFIFTFFLLLGLSTISYSDNLSNLLGEYAQQGDLSSQTKKEAAGHLIVFTRQDLDRMKLKSLTELINYIPFIRYNEDETNLSDITYAPYQYGTFNPLIVYLNDKEIVSPFFGNGFQILSKIDLDFIDHIEVYLGVPSYDIGIHSSLYVIKLYTKKGYRENSTVAGSYYGTYNTNSQYIYTGEGDKDLSYFLYLNRKFLNRRRNHHYDANNGKTYDFSRDSKDYNFYGELDTKNIKFSAEALWMNLDNFIGRSWDMTTKRANSRFGYLSSEAEYLSDDNSFKASINYSYFLDISNQKSDGPLGFLPIPPYYPTYNNFYMRLKEEMSDANVEKTFKIKNDELLLGVMGRYKHFDFQRYKTSIPLIGSIDLKVPDYDREYIYDLYAENKYFFNKSNLVMVSLKTERHILNGGIRNYTLFGAKAGYIYNNNEITFKTYAVYKNNPISSYVLFLQKSLGKDRVSASSSMGFSSEIDYKQNSSVYSALLMQDYNKNFIYFDGHYNNFEKTFGLTGLSLKYQYNFDPFNKIELNGWYVRARNVLSLKQESGGKPEGKDANYFGGLVSMFNKFGKFNLFNSLDYTGVFNDNRPAFNLCSTITYNPTNKLSIYLKGINLLYKGVTTNYLAVNPLTGKATTLNHIQPTDRTVWLGVEYTF